ncbi:hypothetical protein [Streptomyces sp. NPDC088775]|uniref:hypothetical protein n=1 Tax=Streptomyces sp. NPDC088775 TaxID=3365896 RepID=UPI0038182C1C
MAEKAPDFEVRTAGDVTTVVLRQSKAFRQFLTGLEQQFVAAEEPDVSNYPKGQAGE